MVIYAKAKDSDDVLAYLTKTANITHLANVKNWLQINFEPFLNKDKKPRGRKSRIDKQAIIDLRYQQCKSLSYIANVLGCSRGYVEKVIKIYNSGENNAK